MHLVADSHLLYVGSIDVAIVIQIYCVPGELFDAGAAVKSTAAQSLHTLGDGDTCHTGNAIQVHSYARYGRWDGEAGDLLVIGIEVVATGDGTRESGLEPRVERCHINRLDSIAIIKSTATYCFDAGRDSDALQIGTLGKRALSDACDIVSNISIELDLAGNHHISEASAIVAAVVHSVGHIDRRAVTIDIICQAIVHEVIGQSLVATCQKKQQ